MVATASTEHSYWLALAFVARKRLRFLRFSFTQRTQRTKRKRLRLNGKQALDLVFPDSSIIVIGGWQLMAQLHGWIRI